MPPTLSASAQTITPFLSMEVMERGMALARSGTSIVQLGVGEPDFPPPPAVIEATKAAIDAGATHYTDSRGLHRLREAIAADCERRRGVSVDPDRILVTAGSSPALAMVFQALCEPGDEIITPTPYYACYPNMMELAGARAVLVPTEPEDGYRIDVDRVRAAITDRTRGILIASPANPTGAVQPAAVIEELAGLGVPLLSDEIYDGLVFDDASTRSPLDLTDDCFVFDGFSKRYAMTGFRLGYVIAPAWATRSLQKMQQNLYISTTHFVQEAGIAALEHGDTHLAMMRTEYDRRRRRLVAGLRELGFGVPVDPAGAFYVLADARHLGADSLALAFDIVERAHLALGPGRDFGAIAEGFLRFSYATAFDQIEEGLRRLAGYVGA